MSPNCHDANYNESALLRPIYSCINVEHLPSGCAKNFKEAAYGNIVLKLKDAKKGNCTIVLTDTLQAGGLFSYNSACAAHDAKRVAYNVMWDAAAPWGDDNTNIAKLFDWMDFASQNYYKYDTLETTMFDKIGAATAQNVKDLRISKSECLLSSSFQLDDLEEVRADLKVLFEFSFIQTSEGMMDGDKISEHVVGNYGTCVGEMYRYGAECFRKETEGVGDEQVYKCILYNDCRKEPANSTTVHSGVSGFHVLKQLPNATKFQIVNEDAEDTVVSISPENLLKQYSTFTDEHTNTEDWEAFQNLLEYEEMHKMSTTDGVLGHFYEITKHHN